MGADGSAEGVRLYTTRVCPYCVAAKNLLKKKGVSFEEIDVSGDHETRLWLVEASGQRTVPQIFVGATCVGGYQELSALDRSGEFDRLLQAQGAS